MCKQKNPKGKCEQKNAKGMCVQKDSNGMDMQKNPKGKCEQKNANVVGKQQISNYEVWCEEWRKKFLEMNIYELRKKLPEIEEEGEYLAIRFFTEKFRIHKKTGRIIAAKPDGHVSVHTRLVIYTLLGYVSPNAVIKHEWVAFADLKNAGVFAPAFRRGILEPLAASFSGKTEMWAKACEQLKGLRLPYSDMGYQLNAFLCIPMRFLFWEGDDEFPARANILFDRSATDFIHVESTVSIAGEGVHRLAKAAGISLKGASFLME